MNAVVDPDELKFYDAYDNTVYWCVGTQTGFGPDGEPVRADVCHGAQAVAKCEVAKRGDTGNAEIRAGGIFLSWLRTPIRKSFSL